MKGQLAGAATVIRSNLSELTGPELAAFDLCDECARETLTHLREVPIGGGVNYRSHVGQSSGGDLQPAYLMKRAPCQSPDLKAHLQAIIDQNKALMNSTTAAPSPDALITALDSGISFSNNLRHPICPARYGVQVVSALLARDLDATCTREQLVF